MDGFYRLLKNLKLLTHFNSKKNICAFLIGIAAIALLCCISRWPELFAFAANKEVSTLERLLAMPVHLDDDVMISFRTGSILEQMGYPAFNRHDLAQPSTSYLAPYLFALLAKIFPINLAVLMYAILGLFSVGATMAIIYLSSRSTLNALILIVLLLFSTTTREFALNGWDHLFQALFLALAASLFLSNHLNRFTLLAVSLCLAISCLWRPDSALFALAILTCEFIEISRKQDWFVFGILPFASILFPFILHNIIIFGHATPTTSRLKLGASSTFDYSIQYLFNNGILQFSAISIVLILGFIYFYYLAKIGNPRSHTLAFSAILTSLIAAFNSDAFVSGRMFWAPVCVLAVVCGYLSPPLLRAEPEGVGLLGAIGKIKISNFYLPSSAFRSLPLIILLTSLGLILFLTTGSLIANRARSLTVQTNEVYSSATASQYVLTRWIDQHLEPKDGPIGFFFLGVSFHLDKFEAADFLGKADELIARSNKKWGPPGHNKWDFNATLDKWKPQAIIPAIHSDFSNDRIVAEARKKVQAKVDYGFASELILDPRISKDYDYCYVRTFRSDLKDKWGLFLRKDISEVVGNAADCKQSLLGK